MFKLYDYFRSSACFRVRIALNLKNIAYNLIPIHLVNNGGEQFKPDYIQINPQSLVPTLITPEGPLTQSLAIIEWLDDYQPNTLLLPKNAYERALVHAFALTIAADIHPLNNLRVLNYLTKELKINETQKSKWYQNWITKGLHALEKQLLQQKKMGDFCYGDAPTLADVCLVPQLYNARRFNCDLTSYPELVRIDANCQRLDAFRNAWPSEKVTKEHA